MSVAGRLGVVQAEWSAVLKRGPSGDRIEALAKALGNAGQHDESFALRRWARHGSEARARWSTWPWNGTICVAGPTPPRDPEPGTIWFDVVSLIPFYLPPAKEDLARSCWSWLAVSPVRTWQFQSVCDLIRWRPYKTDFLEVNDLFEPVGRLPPEGTAPATRVYHEEACAFASWLGLVLAGETDLLTMREQGSPGQMDSVAPHGLRLWDGAEMSASEFLRLAWGQHTLDVNEGAEYIALRDDKIDLEDCKVLLHEWDALPDVGFSLSWTAGQRMTARTPPKRVFEFVELDNLAPREQFPEEGLGA